MLLLEHDCLQDRQHTHPIGSVGGGSVAELVLHCTAVVLLEDPQGPHGDSADPGSARAENPSGSKLHQAELSKDALRNLSRDVSKDKQRVGRTYLYARLLQARAAGALLPARGPTTSQTRLLGVELAAAEAAVPQETTGRSWLDDASRSRSCVGGGSHRMGVTISRRREEGKERCKNDVVGKSFITNKARSRRRRDCCQALLPCPISHLTQFG